jgi:hypothetical protein
VLECLCVLRILSSCIVALLCGRLYLGLTLKVTKNLFELQIFNLNKVTSKMIAVAIAIVTLLFSCTQTQAAECATTYPICGEGSKLCPHNMCTKPNGGKCNMSGDGCLDIRWNRDSCLSPENTCGSGYCGERDSILVSILTIVG